MLFPELADRLKGYLSAHGGMTTLGLKSGFVGPYPTPGVYQETVTDYYARNGFYKLNQLGAGSWSGERVTVDTALNHSVVFACNRIISEPTAFLPLSMMQHTSQGKRAATEKPMYRALHDQPNDEMTAMEFRETRTSNCVLGGNGYAKIMRRSGTGEAIELWPLNPSQLTPDRDKSDRLVYIDDANKKTYTVERGKPQDILHIRGIGWDGLRGYSVLTMARQSIGTALAAERNVGAFYANGGRVPYHLETESKFKTDADFDKFRADWTGTYRQPHLAPILENGIKLVQDGLSMADAQMLETRQFTVADLCRWFNVKPHFAADLSRATFSNIEQLALEFVTFTLGAWLNRWEQALWRCILTDAEKAAGYYFKHSVNALLRGDFVSRMAGYASALQNGHLNQDEVRDYEDLNPLPDGEGSYYRVQLNMQTLTADGQMIDPAAAHLAARAKQESNNARTA